MLLSREERLKAITYSHSSINTAIVLETTREGRTMQFDINNTTCIKCRETRQSNKNIEYVSGKVILVSSVIRNILNIVGNMLTKVDRLLHSTYKNHLPTKIL